MGELFLIGRPKNRKKSRIESVFLNKVNKKGLSLYFSWYGYHQLGRSCVCRQYYLNAYLVVSVLYL